MEEKPQPPIPPVSEAPTELAIEGSEQLSARPQLLAPQQSGSDGIRTEPNAIPTLNDGANLKQATLLAADVAATPIISRDIESYVGFIIDGRYHVESVLAQGGMGVVYRARHRLLDKLVAIKILRPELVNNRDITRRFLTEAQAASAIGSKHIVDITDFGELPDGATYIVMEYLDGAPLSQHLKQAEPRISQQLVLDVARQLAEGLAHAHAAQIVHRDLKPDNVVLIQLGKRENFAKILDFGIAKVASSQNETTRAGKIFGTPHYMSPEQARGESLDARTDIYSLGVMLFEMLTGHLPFVAENPLGVLTQHMYVETPLLIDHLDAAEISVAWEAVVAKCLSKRREDRYLSMAELDADLLRLTQNLPPLALPQLAASATTPERLRTRLGWKRPPARSRLLRPGVLFGLLILVGIGFFYREMWLPVVSAQLVAWREQLSPGDDDQSLVSIDMVLSPIDAHVFQGNKDLGMMPIRLRLRHGQRVSLSVRRHGFKSQTLVVDGTRSRIEVELHGLPGNSSPTPIARPSADLGRTRTVSLADLESSPVASGRSPDAGNLPLSISASVIVPIVPEAVPTFELPVPPPGPPPQAQDQDPSFDPMTFEGDPEFADPEAPPEPASEASRIIPAASDSAPASGVR